MDTTGTGSLGKKGKKPADFDAKELNEIMKFGAAELFKDAAEDDAQLEALDLDAVLGAAETHNSEAAVEGMNSELLSAFKTVDIATNEEELDEPKQGSNWDDIIPEDERRKIQEKEEQARLKQMYMSEPRRRTQVTYAGGDTAEPTAQDTDDVFKPSKSRAKGRGKAKSGQALDHVRAEGGGSFTEEEVRQVYVNLRKYGDREEVHPVVAEAAGISAKLDELPKLIRWLVKSSEEVWPQVAGPIAKAYCLLCS
jgi:chromodomain-helicase-DNA-binding protein 1